MVPVAACDGAEARRKIAGAPVARWQVAGQEHAAGQGQTAAQAAAIKISEARRLRRPFSRHFARPYAAHPDVRSRTFHGVPPIAYPQCSFELVAFARVSPGLEGNDLLAGRGRSAARVGRPSSRLLEKTAMTA